MYPRHQGEQAQPPLRRGPQRRSEGLPGRVAGAGAQSPPDWKAVEAEAVRTIQSYVRIDTSNVQQALAALQDKSLIWREKRGVYALEEAGTASVMRGAGLLDGAA